MSFTAKILYYGVWGSIFGFALYYGWRIMLGIIAPPLMILIGNILEGKQFDPLVTGYLLNESLNIICGLLVGVIISLTIRIIFKPRTMHFAVIPVIVLLGNGYWWLIASMIDKSFYPSNWQLASYITGPIVVGLAFIATYWLVARNPNNPIQPTSLRSGG